LKNLSQQNQQSCFNPKQIRESTHVIPDSQKTLTQKTEKPEDIFSEQTPKKRKYNKKKGPKLILNLSCCQYKVVKEVGLDLNFKITSEKDSNNFETG
jgi:hypothetical protein